MASALRNIEKNLGLIEWARKGPFNGDGERYTKESSRIQYKETAFQIMK